MDPVVLLDAKAVQSVAAVRFKSVRCEALWNTFCPSKGAYRLAMESDDASPCLSWRSRQRL